MPTGEPSGKVEDSVLAVRILSHNIRYATSSPFKGEKPWDTRKQRLINQLHYHSRFNLDTIICLQEVLHGQLEDIFNGLNNSCRDSDEWAYIGVGRDDGQKAGEYAPIFYRSISWRVEHFETVWLSETPGKPSKGWDASSFRIATIALFKSRISGKLVLGINTHLDDQGSVARHEAARLILAKIDHYTKESSYSTQIDGFFLAGDFNSEDCEGAYKLLTADESPLVDGRNTVEPTLRYGNEITYTGFGYEDEPEKRIDYILTGPKDEGIGPWRTQGYAVLPNLFEDGVFISDHRAVVIDLRLH